MPDYNSAYTGAQIDDAVGSVQGSGSGIVVKTGVGSGAKRQIDGTTNEIEVSNGDGVSGNPTISLSTPVKDSLALADTALQANSNISDLNNDSGYVVSDVTGITGADQITNIVSLTQAEYDAIVTPDPATLYIITD
jgi:hypothetical protein